MNTNTRANEARVCSVCGEVLPFVYRDKDIGMDLGAPFAKGTRSDKMFLCGFLSGVLRKYYCPNGHEIASKDKEAD